MDNGHRHDIVSADMSKPISAHFVNHNHSMDDVTVVAVEKTNGQRQRKNRELYWISQLMTDFPFGLNIEHVFHRSSVANLSAI